MIELLLKYFYFIGHELASDSLDLFSMPPIEKGLIHGKTVTCHLNSTLTDRGPFEFIIPSDNNDYTQMNDTRLEGEIEVVKTDGTALTKDEKTSVCNIFPHSIFSQIELYCNDNLICDLSTPTYGYKAWIEKHLSFERELKENVLRDCEMYYKETASSENTFDFPAAGKPETAFSLKATRIIGKKIYFSINLHLDFLHSKRLLLPGCTLKFKFVRSDDTFSLISDTLKAKIKVNDLKMSVRRITIDPGISAAIENRLEKEPAVYPVVQSKIKTVLINSGIQTINISQIIRGPLPRSIIIGFVSSKASDGHINQNPYCFKNFDLNYFNPYLNGEPIITTPFRPDYSKGDCVREYQWFLANTGCKESYSNDISLEDFKANSCFYSLDLTADLCNNFYLHPTESGTFDMHIGFKANLTENLTCIIYSSYNEFILIDKNRNVTVVPA